MLEDIALMRALPNMHIYTASTDIITKNVIKNISKDQNPSYVRLYRMETEEHYEKLTKEEIETFLKNGMIVKGIPGVELENHDIIIVTMGDMIDVVYNVQKRLKEEYNGLVIDVIRLKPFNEKMIVQILNNIENAKIVTVEDHSIYGGLRKHNI